MSTAAPFKSPEVRVVEASAGSGKTYALAKRYVQLALNPKLTFEQAPIRNILALTFTNKAAFEMKARILEFLKKIALKQLKDSEVDDILKPIGLTAEKASLKAYAVMEGVIRQYNFFQVQTIDKFINALLSGCAFKIGLTANFKIKTDSRDYLQQSLDQLIDAARHDKKTLKFFQEFLHHYLYLENRSGWFPKDDILTIITTLFEQNNAYGHPFLSGNFSSQDVAKLKKTIANDIRKLREQLPPGTHATFVKSVDKFITVSEGGYDADKLPDSFAREEIWVKKNTEIPADAEKTWKKLSKDFRRLCVAEAYSLFNPYVELFARTLNGFADLAAKDDCLFLNELNKRASELFDDNHVTVEELYYRLATRFHHYLIDEFQDTSRLQWHNLHLMAEEALSTGGTLFYVGDRKQAIYGFRGGDAGLFDSIKQSYDAFNVQVDVLANNWRSQRAVVDFNNHIFSGDNLQRFIQDKAEYEAKKKNAVYLSQEDIGSVLNVFGEAQQKAQVEDQKGYVHIERIDIGKKEERNEAVREKIVTLIADLKKRFRYKDIAILTRGNQEIAEMTKWFLEEDIPVDSERTSDISENTIVKEITAFLTFLNSPIDNLAFASFITGDVFAKATGLSKESMHDFIFSLRPRLSAEKDLNLYREFRKQYPEVWDEYIEEFFANIGLYPLYELIITIYRRFNVLSFADAQGFCMHFLELVKSNEEDHADLPSFLEYFENLKGDDLYVQVADSDAVKILTIHKAKGLEFPVVIIPYLGMDIQIGVRSGEYQPSYIMRQDDGHLQLMRIKQKYRKFAPELNTVYEDEYKQAFLSELNNIYVALTRPKHELYAFIPQRIGNRYNIANFLIPDDQLTCGAKHAYDEDDAKEDKIWTIPPASYPDWIDYLKDEFASPDDIRNRDQKLKGEVMHYALQHIGNLATIKLEDAAEQAMKAVTFQFVQLEDIDSYREHLMRVLSAEALQPFFNCKDAEVFTEREIVNAYGHTKRCDRLIVTDDSIRIVDYKSTTDTEGRDVEQVQEYMDILRGIEKDKTVEGYIIYLDSQTAKQV